jgi:hypothetical protein
MCFLKTNLEEGGSHILMYFFTNRTDPEKRYCNGRTQIVSANRGEKHEVGKAEKRKLQKHLKQRPESNR